MLFSREIPPGTLTIADVPALAHARCDQRDLACDPGQSVEFSQGLSLRDDELLDRRGLPPVVDNLRNERRFVYRKPFIDRRYELSQVADAFRYLKEGHARGKIVISGLSSGKDQMYVPELVPPISTVDGGTVGDLE